MFAQIKTIVTRSRDTLLYDFAGVLSLAGLTIGLLHLPGLI